MTARCPFCGALLDVEWSRWHAPHCPERNPLPRIAEALARVDHALDRVCALVAGDPPTDRADGEPPRSSAPTLATAWSRTHTPPTPRSQGDKQP